MFDKIKPHLIAIAVFAAITFAYFLPYYQGQTLNQGDIVQFNAMSKEIKDWNAAHPDDPALWTSRMFSGMPATQISLIYPGNWVYPFTHSFHAIFPDASLYIFMMFVGAYIFLLCLGASPWVSIAGSLAYGLSSFTLTSLEAGHNTKIQAMSLIAPVLGGIVLAYSRNILLGVAVFAFALAMQIDSNHLQITYYTILISGMLGIYYAVTSVLEKKLAHFAKASAGLILAAVIAVLPNFAALWNTQEYGKETIRGGGSELTQKKADTNGGLDFEYATRWSYGLTDMEFFTFLIPDMKGGASGGSLDESSATYEALTQNGVPANQAQQYIARLPLYWGNQPFTSGPIYFGAAAMFLFILSFFVVRSSIKWWIAAVCILSVLLGFGHNTPFFKLLFNTLPFFNKFRTPTMALAIAQLCVPVMAALGLQEILNGTFTKDELLKKLKIAGGITAGLVAVVGIIGASTFSFSSPGDAQYAESFPEWMMAAIKKDRASLLRADAFRSLFFIVAAFGVLWFFIQQKLSRTILLVAISALVLIDSWSVGKRYLNDESFVDAEQYKTGNYQPNAADLEILKDTDPNFRVFNTTRDAYNDALTSYYHKHVGGYHAVKLIKYQDLIENQLSKGNMSVFNMLNTRYFIGSNPQTKEPIAQRNPNACGNAWFVPQVQLVKNADEEMKSLDNFDPKQTLFVDQRYSTLVKAPTAFDSAATVTLTLFSPNKLVYESNSATDGVAVFSEVYYDKGWNAYLDGKKTDYFRGDYVLRAMSLPAGKHNIEFRFEPRPYFAGMKVSYAGSVILFAFVLGIFGWFIYQAIQKNKTAVPTSTQTAKKK